jgi:hypothetical protein
MSVFQWADRLGESKVHVVRATLCLIGEGEMRSVANEAARRFGRGEAKSLGGAFISVIKNMVYGGDNVYERAKELSGENDRERERIRRRKRLKKSLKNTLQITAAAVDVIVKNRL